MSFYADIVFGIVEKYVRDSSVEIEKEITDCVDVKSLLHRK